MDFSSDEKLALAILLFLTFLGSTLVIWRNAVGLRSWGPGRLVAYDDGVAAGDAVSEGEDLSFSGPQMNGSSSNDFPGRDKTGGWGESEEPAAWSLYGGPSALEDEMPPLIIHVAGAVKEPGVYSLQGRARVKDAIDAAGGFLPGAAVHYLNLAEALSDGEKIYVPSSKEIDNALNGMTPFFAQGSGGSPANRVTGSSSPYSSGTGKPGKPVNINTASEEELDTLPGIGPVLAERIVRSRLEEGPFKSVDDLMRVRGIGKGLMENLREFATVK